ncbi:MAG: hypothetical protein V4469_01315 [Patescibacteria group bacterium]
MIFLLILIIIVGGVGAVAFLNINKGSKIEAQNDADEYEISEIL